MAPDRRQEFFIPRLRTERAIGLSRNDGSSVPLQRTCMLLFGAPAKAAGLESKSKVQRIRWLQEACKKAGFRPIRAEAFFLFLPRLALKKPKRKEERRCIRKSIRI